MNNRISLPMYRRNGTRVQLREVISAVDGKDYEWRFLDFDGVASAFPRCMDFSDFRNECRKTISGVEVSWSELQAFTESVEYVIDCILIAKDPAGVVEFSNIESHDAGGCEIFISALDSTVWDVFCRDANIFKRIVKVIRGS